MKNTKNYSIICPYCGSRAICKPASTVYGADTIDRKSYLYLCSRWPVCDAYVSAHKKDLKPMGTLANGELRHKRILAHHALKKLQKERHMDKWAVYVWLQANLGLDEHHAHIGMFSLQMCDQVISLCRSPMKPDNHLAA
ncbi:MAG: DUF3268 family zinc-finger domain-containing protein [Lachnospiraceae bacterium]|nr:DUF3268 family zinc-finger domain-containing protein [Lachnospiraceae bacterium]MCM1239023.1 DUF3268 family zinc-finger domain-containing protein [Lachnospiraceae bacterium]